MNAIRLLGDVGTSHAQHYHRYQQRPQPELKPATPRFSAARRCWGCRPFPRCTVATSGATRVRDLLDSLYRGYPSGAILLWETDEAVPLQEMAVLQALNPYPSTRLLLDAQQRLTSLSAVTQVAAVVALAVDSYIDTPAPRYRPRASCRQ